MPDQEKIMSRGNGVNYKVLSYSPQLSAQMFYVRAQYASILSTGESCQHSGVCYGASLIPYPIYLVGVLVEVANSLNDRYFFIAVAYQVAAWTTTLAAL